MKLSTRQLEILQHALGVDQYGQGAMNHNHFGCSTVTTAKPLGSCGPPFTALAYVPACWNRSEVKPEWGISYEEALEYAYENVLFEARQATKGRRRPKPKEPRP